MLFNYETAEQFATSLKSMLSFPFVRANISNLGGNENVAIMLTISTEPKENWANGIIHNAKYAMFHIENDGTVSNFSGTLPKIRKFKAKSVQDIVNKIQYKTGL